MLGPSYGTLAQVGDDLLEFTVNGRVQRTWKLGPPIASMDELVQRCLTNLGHDGWRPITHQSGLPGTVVLARVPYTAGSKLSSYGTLRHLEDGTLVLTVSGSAMREWQADGDRGTQLAGAIQELEHEGWRVHRRYRLGATVVRG